MTSQATARGLEGVVIGDSTICKIDGAKGELSYRGYSIGELGERATFEEVAHLLWLGDLPDRAALAEIGTALRDALALPPGIADQIRSLPRAAVPMDALRTLASLLGTYEESGAASREPLTQAVRLTGALSSGMALFHRHRQQLPAVEPRPDLGHAANFLWMLTGELPERDAARIFDVALILHMEHGLNASTFSGRVTTSTLADLHGAVTAAIATLKGPLHGGANERVMAMLEEIGSPQQAAAWVRERLAKREKIMGFGHRVYKTTDPRATVLRGLAKGLARSHGERLFEISEIVVGEVAAALGDKGIAPNVDFFSASVYSALGIPRDLFTPVFALARVVGWTAHILEQLADNRLIRPKANYTGAVGRSYVPLAER